MRMVQWQVVRNSAERHVQLLPNLLTLCKRGADETTTDDTCLYEHVRDGKKDCRINSVN